MTRNRSESHSSKSALSSVVWVCGPIEAQRIVNTAGTSERYTVSADKLESGEVKLNGTVLKLGLDDTLPGMAGVAEHSGPIRLSPATITFLTVPSAGNPQCGAK